MPEIQNQLGLYIHIPFCRRRCHYCHFVTVAHEAERIEPYIGAVESELRFRARRDPTIDTIYIGGGSPSILPVRELATILETVSREYSVSPSPEVTLEMNPGDVDAEALGLMHSLGINRLSIGVQSFQREDLRYLGRTHSAEDSIRAVCQALDAGFENLSIDFIIGLPTQDSDTLDRNARWVMDHGIPHVSCYLLEGVRDKGVDDEQEANQFHRLRSIFLAGGYHHYEVSNYAMEGRQCKHNMKYWQNREYLAVGLSAAGFIDGSDYRNTAVLDTYCRRLSRGHMPGRKRQVCEASVRPLIMGLRLLDGIPREKFAGFEEATQSLLEEGHLILKGDSLAVHPTKLLLLNEILLRFL
jgi:oxygen-independent coproporphyrinogen-3 oxidase